MSLLPFCTNRCGIRTDTGRMCRDCLDDTNNYINAINTVATRYIVLTASTKKLAEQLLEWWWR